MVKCRICKGELPEGSPDICKICHNITGVNPTTDFLEMWFINLPYSDKLALYEGSSKIGVDENV